MPKRNVGQGLGAGACNGVRVWFTEAVGRRLRTRYHGVACDVVCLPHPSGASTWFKTEPGRGLLERALRILARHPEVRRAFPPRAGRARPLTPTRRGVR